MLSDTGDVEFRDINPEKISADNCNLDINMYSVFNVGLVESELFVRFFAHLRLLKFLKIDEIVRFSTSNQLIPIFIFDEQLLDYSSEQE